MWKLTISQKKKNTYLKDGKDVSYDSEQGISFESKNLESLLVMVTNFEKFKPVNTKYEISRVEEGVKER